METRGLTYSYTFYTNPKNALTGCKGTKNPQTPKGFSNFLYLLYNYCLDSDDMLMPPIVPMFSITGGLHTSYIPKTYGKPFIYGTLQCLSNYEIMPPVTYQLHTLCPEWHIPLIVPTLVLRLLLLDLSCNQSIFYNA